VHEKDDTIQSNISVIGDGDPLQDVCSNGSIDQVTMGSRNIGDLLSAKNITWGSFMGGFNLSIKNPNGTTGCNRATPPQAPGTPAFTSVDYIPHHAWFQHFVCNPTHARPRSIAAIGTGYYGGMVTDPANHNYDILDFFTALKATFDLRAKAPGNRGLCHFTSAANGADGADGALAKSEPPRVKDRRFATPLPIS
jgi:hypothetical protein